jgi:hypothetical protein
LALVLFCIRAFTVHLLELGTNTRLFGNEFSYLINAGAIAHIVFQKTGAIPLWNPLIGLGEPLLESPFSFILNPLMAWPVLIAGPLDGAKFAAVLHVAVMGVGGWLLGYVLGCRVVGRVTMALLLAGSGSMAATVGNGFYQMGLSQAYMPWILAGTYGTLFTRQRWPIVVLVTATVLLLFAGTYWYALPSAIGAGLLVLFGIFRWDPRRPFHIQMHWDRTRRVIMTAVILLGLAAVRVLPQLINSALVAHPGESLNETFSFLATLLQYFQRTPPDPNMREAVQHYHYVLPLYFAVGVLAVRVMVGFIRFLVVRPAEALRPAEWRIVIPALMMIFLLTIWGMGGTPLMRSLYQAIPFLQEWRYVGRVGAAAVVWVALLAALWLDDVAQAVQRALFPTQSVARAARRWYVVVADSAVLALVLGSGILVGLEALNNWRTMAGVVPVRDYERAPLAFLRAQHPTDFLPVYTPGFFAYLPHYEFLVRASFGNPDYRPLGLPTTIGSPYTFSGVAPTYALVISDPISGYLQDQIGYRPIPGAPKPFGYDVLFQDPKTPPYTFTTTLERLTRSERRNQPLEGFDTLDVSSYIHNIDSIDVKVGNWPLDSVLIVQETAYPGWSATINGTPVIVESIGERIGVKLPNDVAKADIVFAYRPPLLYESAAISGLFFVIFTIYALQMDRRLPAPLRRRIEDRWNRRSAAPIRAFWARVNRQLSRSDIFEPKREGKNR